MKKIFYLRLCLFILIQHVVCSSILAGPYNLFQVNSTNYHWNTYTVNYKINENGSQYFPPPHSVEISSIDAAFDTWQDVTPSTLQFSYGGTTSNTHNINDSQNVLFWETTAYYSSDAVARTLITVDPNTAELIDVDIAFNDEDYQWTSDNLVFWTHFDVQSIATHEIGHLCGIAHSDPYYTGCPTMMSGGAWYYYCEEEAESPNLEIRSLSQDDENALNYLYGSTLRVPQVFQTLEEGLNFAQSGQSVLVSNGTHLVTNSLSVGSGIILQIANGSIISISPDRNLSIYGSLIVDGNSSNYVTFERNGASGTWGGIQFNSGSNGSISYANIQHATTGVKFESGSSGSVSNSTLSNNAYGIYISSAEPTIENNTISSNSYGIYVTNSYSPSWTVEHIKNNSIQSNSAYGIYLYNSSPTLSSNSVSGCNNGTALFTNCNSKVYDNDFVSNSSYGFACYGSSSPSVYYNTNYSFGGYNSFLSNGSDEVRITGSSNPNFGNYFFDGNNSFDDNSGYLMYNSTGSTISAENNWWGSSSGPGVNQIYGSVDYDPYLDEDPNNPSRAIFIDNPSLAVSNINSTENLSNAFNAYYGGNFTLAASLFKEYLNQNPKSESALEIIQYYLQSLNMYKSRTDMLSDFNILLRLKLNDNIRNEVISLYAAYLESNENYDDALLQLESLMGKETEDEFKNRVKLQKAYLLINSKKDSENAKALFEEVLQNTSDDSYLFEIASAELNNLSGTRSTFAQPLAKKADSNEENNTVWLKNYPNPFNAETVIKFSLPKESDVEIAVYNFLGQKIAVLVNNKLPAGQHSVKLNASSFTSGIYFLTLRTGGEMQTIKVSLMK